MQHKQLVVGVLLFMVTHGVLCQYQDLVGSQIWQLQTNKNDDSSVVQNLHLKGFIDVLHHSRAEVKVAPSKIEQVKQTLLENNIKFEILIEDIAEYLQKQEASRVVRSTQSCTADLCYAPLTDEYMTFEQMEYYLQHINKTYSRRVEVTSIGKSEEGRDIWLVHLKPSQPCGTDYAVWLEGGLHAREWISPATTLQLIDRMLKSCSVGKLFNIYVVPMANPDGYIYSRTNNRYWRKNRGENSGSSCVGTDLNRNWDFDYGKGASSYPCSDVYMGSAPFSASETLSLKTGMEKVDNEKDLILVMAIHSYGEILLHPYGGRYDTAPYETEMINLANTFSDAASKSYGTSYGVTKSINFGLASGATDDWAKGVLNTKYSYTLELRDSGQQGFVLSPDQILPTGQEIWDGFIAILEEIYLKG